MDALQAELGDHEMTRELAEQWLGRQTMHFPKWDIPIDPDWARIAFGVELDAPRIARFETGQLVKWQRDRETPHLPTLQALEGRLATFWGIDLVRRFAPSDADRNELLGELQAQHRFDEGGGRVYVQQRRILNPDERIYIGMGLDPDGSVRASSLMIQRLAFVRRVAEQHAWNVL